MSLYEESLAGFTQTPVNSSQCKTLPTFRGGINIGKQGWRISPPRTLIMDSQYPGDNPPTVISTGNLPNPHGPPPDYYWGYGEHLLTENVNTVWIHMQSSEGSCTSYRTFIPNVSIFMEMQPKILEPSDWSNPPNYVFAKQSESSPKLQLQVTPNKQFIISKFGVSCRL